MAYIESGKVLECFGLASNGSGVCRDQGMTTFVPGLLPGEKGEVIIEERKKNWQRGKLRTLMETSPLRTEPPCGVFRVCGGCQLQHMDYALTLEWKTRWVEDALARIGKVKAEVYQTIGMEFPWRYRNKARLHRAGSGKLGYFQEKTNSNIIFADCLLLSEQMNAWAGVISGFLDENRQIHTVTLRVNTQHEGLILCEGNYQPALIKKAEQWATEWNQNNLKSIWGINNSGTLENWWGTMSLSETIMGMKFAVSPLAFFQVNSIQTEVLYNLVLDWANLTGKELVWDLYCGVGTMTLALARKAAKVLGIEENPYAVIDARQNAKNNAVNNVQFEQGKVELLISELEEKPDLVVLDPPRAGLQSEVIAKLLELKPRQIIYVSCDPGTLARDTGSLVSGGYSLTRVQPVDMFPWTQHVETVMSLRKRTV